MEKFPKSFYLKLLGLVLCLYLIFTNTKAILVESGSQWNFGLKQLENSQSIQTQDTSIEADNLKTSQEKAGSFNQSIDIIALNKELSNLSGLGVADYLQTGVDARLTDLSTYKDLGSSELENRPFYTYFPDVPDSQYRLGEKSYELYISASDIHLETWKNPQILAQHLFEAMGVSDDLNRYQSHWITIKAQASDYNISEASYVRLLAVLAFDVGG